MTDGTKKKILIVDDDQDVLAFLQSFLEHHGFDVYLASTAREGVRLAKHANPDLVILDVMMPEQGGLTVYSQLRFVRGHDTPIPVIVYSAAPSFLIHGKVDGLPKDDVLAKSEDLTELFNVIKARLGISGG